MEWVPSVRQRVGDLLNHLRVVPARAAAESAAHVVTRALCRAVVATFVLQCRLMFQALAEVHGLRSKAGGLVAPLCDVDALLAKANGAAPQPSFSELGHDVIAAVEALARRLEKIPGVDAPTTRARWKDFVGATADEED